MTQLYSGAIIPPKEKKNAHEKSDALQEFIINAAHQPLINGQLCGSFGTVCL